MNKSQSHQFQRHWLVILILLVSAPVALADESGANSAGNTDTAIDASADNAPTASASIELKTTSVTGSRELPKVLVIVPWKSPDAIGPGGRPLASLVEEALTPLDPDVFRRQLSYYTELRSSDAKRSQSAASTAVED